MGAAALRGLLPDCEYRVVGGPGEPAARGYVFDGPDGSWVVPTLHPSPKNLRGKKSAWAIIVHDFAKAARIAKNGLTRRPFTQNLYPSFREVAEYFSTPRHLVIDVENTMAGKLQCVGFCDGEATMVVSAELLPLVEGVLKSIFANPEWTKTFQNGVHDCTVLASNGFPVHGWIGDTMFMHAACYSDQLHSLHHLGSLYWDGPPWKPIRRVESTEPEVTK